MTNAVKPNQSHERTLNDQFLHALLLEFKPERLKSSLGGAKPANDCLLHAILMESFALDDLESTEG